MKRVVVTGIGVLTAIGNNVPDYLEGLKSGKSGAKPITQFDAEQFKTQFACEVTDWDPTDRLDRKLHRLFAHQLLLGDMPAARPALAVRGIGSLQRELEMKGRLFSHPGTSGNRPSACAAPPPGQRYVTLGELRRGGMTGTGYRILKRWEWLAPVISGSGRLLDARDLHSRVGGVVARDKRPVQVAECCPDGRELCRFFVVPDHWPALAASA